jgi:NAD-dependent SIR2 family protein deacetylase
MLQRVYTQNIDMLESVVGIEQDRLVEAHGSLNQAECIECGRLTTDEEMAELWHTVMHKHAAPRCGCNGIIRPRVTFFGEPLPDRFALAHPDLSTCELLIVMGTSLVVYPFAGLVQMVPPLTPRLLINRKRTGPFQYVGVEGESRTSQYRDAVFEGDCDEGVNALESALS